MEFINNILSGMIMPSLLIVFGIYCACRLRFFYILHPLRVAGELSKSAGERGSSPLRALTQALAGTLGIGNMTGVASAICAGGAGAIFWMWVSALVAMSIKYFEAALAVKCARVSGSERYGGAMYYINDIFKKRLPKAARAFGGIFAVLCIVNSLLTGNIVQMNGAAAALSPLPPLFVGALCVALALPVICKKGKRVSGVTFFLIPILSGIYIILSLIIIIPNAGRIPAVFSLIISEAFSLRCAGCGMGSYLFLRAIRFGTTRGIFSNEAGSGTSPTAHAEADCKSPHSQGCLGIFEVFADTVIMCTLTALVILLSDGCKKGLSGMALTVYAFSSQAGEAAGTLVRASALLFAYATVICQARYGAIALHYLTKRKSAQQAYAFAVCAFALAGTVISEGIMWQAADLIVSLMTALNIICLWYGAKNQLLSEIYAPAQPLKAARKTGREAKNASITSPISFRRYGSDTARKDMTKDESVIRE